MKTNKLVEYVKKDDVLSKLKEFYNGHTELDVCYDRGLENALFYLPTIQLPVTKDGWIKVMRINDQIVTEKDYELMQKTIIKEE